MTIVRDLQFRLQTEGRDYVIEVCAPGRNPASVSAGPFDVHIAVDVAEILPEWKTAEPERVVRQVTDYVVFARAEISRARSVDEVCRCRAGLGVRASGFAGMTMLSILEYQAPRFHTHRLAA